MKKIFFSLIVLSIMALPDMAIADQTILWIPYHSSVINEGLKILEANENIKITIALDQISPAMEKRIKPLEEKGQLEVALRLPNDPVIPLLYYPNSEHVSWKNKPVKSALPDNAPYFMGLRIGMAMDHARKNLKRRPVGLVLPPGSVMKDYFPLAKGIGIKWIASGPFYYDDEEDSNAENSETEKNSTGNESGGMASNVQNAANTQSNEIAEGYYASAEEEQGGDYSEDEPTEASIAEANGVKVIPFTSYAENADNEKEEFIVFDETAEENPGPIRTAFKAYLSNITSNTRTAGEVAENMPAAEISPEELEKTVQPWTSNYDRWASKRSQMGALVAMSQTRSELMKYLNSKAGNMNEALPAFNAYYEAENSRRFLNLASEDKETAKSSEIEMRSTVTNIFRIMERKPPQWTFSSISDAGTGKNTALMRVAMQKTGFEIKNDQKPPVFDKKPDGLPSAVDPYKIWKLNSFKVEAANDSFIFKFVPAAINNSASNLSGFSHISIDLYIDVNHRINAGSTALLPGRPMKMAAEYCWEYALEISPTSVYLYRSGSLGAKQIGKYRARVVNGEITVSIPSTVLRGTPRSWGYAVLMMVPQDSNRYHVADTLSSNMYANTIYAVRPGIED